MQVIVFDPRDIFKISVTDTYKKEYNKYFYQYISQNTKIVLAILMHINIRKKLHLPSPILDVPPNL
jgi:hypothetical protein